jgi:hypothetical protein
MQILGSWFIKMVSTHGDFPAEVNGSRNIRYEAVDVL